jgi:hypothetical protein
MKRDLEMLKLDGLVELRNEINQLIQDYKDGYFYICEVRSYGRNWKENNIYNIKSLQDLCYEYYGDDGIVDVYSNNPDLSRLDNYGDVMFVPTEDDLQNWKAYTYLKNSIPRHEEELDKWDKRDDVPFKYRPMFAPTHSREDLEHLKKRLEDFDMSFVAPVRVVRVYDDEE